MRLLPDLFTSWESKDIENFDDPTIRLVGCRFEGDNGNYTHYESTFMANDEWFLGYERWFRPEWSKDNSVVKYINYIHDIKVGDVLIMSHKFGSSTHVKAIAIGIILWFKDLPVIDETSNEPTDRTYRVFKIAWTNRNINLELPNKGFWDKGGSASQGYKKSQILSEKFPAIEEKSVLDSYKALLKEVDKARHRFLRLNLNRIAPRNY